MNLLAIIRPDSWNWALLVHVGGAMILVGALLTAGTASMMMRRDATGTLATFYFDSGSGLLVRLVRYAESRVGRLPTQIDFSDYRDVAGVKMPFKWKMTWLDGFEDVTLTEIQPNPAIDAAKFAKPR